MQEEMDKQKNMEMHDEREMYEKREIEGGKNAREEGDPSEMQTQEVMKLQKERDIK